MMSDAGPQVAVKALQRGATQATRSNPVASMVRAVPKPGASGVSAIARVDLPATIVRSMPNPTPASVPATISKSNIAPNAQRNAVQYGKPESRRVSPEEWYEQVRLNRIRKEEIIEAMPVRSKDYIVNIMESGNIAELNTKEIRSLGIRQYIKLSDARWAKENPLQANKGKIAIAASLLTYWLYYGDKEWITGKDETNNVDTVAVGVQDKIKNMIESEDIDSVEKEIANILGVNEGVGVQARIAGMLAANKASASAAVQTDTSKKFASGGGVPELKVGVNAVNLDEITRT